MKSATRIGLNLLPSDSDDVKNEAKKSLNLKEEWKSAEYIDEV